jgi:hypothetical protein
MRTNIRFITSRLFLLRMRNVSDKSCRRTQKVPLCKILFFFKLCRLRKNVEKRCRTGQAADDNTAHAHFTLST